MTGIWRIIQASLAAALLMAAPAYGQSLSITKESDLVFGKIARGISTATARVRPNGNLLCNARLTCLGGQSAAQFRITGKSGSIVAIQSDTNATLSAPNGGTMDVLLELNSTSITLSSKKGNLLKIGGTLTVSSTQAAGDYTGTFTITANYN